MGVHGGLVAKRGLTLRRSVSDLIYMIGPTPQHGSYDGFSNMNRHRTLVDNYGQFT